MKAWALPATVIVAIEYATALLIGWLVGFRYTIPFGSYLIVALVIVSFGLVAFVSWRLLSAIRFGNVPLDLQRFAPFAVGVILVALQMGVLGWTKTMLAATHYWADPFLANLDRGLFGTDPWRLFISFNGPIIDRAYVTWLPVKFSLLVALVCAPESPKKARALLSYFLIMLTGSIGQYALPSAGPLFHQPVPLNQWVADSRDYLWQAYVTGHGRVGSGISAMPSMHVAIAMWMALVVRAYVPKLAVLGFGYLILIFIGSIALGWHYATDSIAAVGIALLAWNISAVSAARLERRRTALAS